jgi:hypothetical protein
MGAPPRPLRLPSTARTVTRWGEALPGVLWQEVPAQRAEKGGVSDTPLIQLISSRGVHAIHGTHGRAHRVTPGSGGGNKDPSHGPGLQVRRMHDFFSQPCVVFLPFALC